ncbi:MAG: pyridoxine 5'-phosphate synthase [Proteobacteria bacterium]|nr:pyridoxine 5'-phosphate synthase [Pseudomonadota bacterium]
MIRLGVNIDHIATVRQARGESYPDPVQGALLAEIGGADNITAHLREDRRHIQDRDIFLLKETIKIPLNFEMACTSEMLKIALQVKPHAVTLVPEKREERTTEGGLDLKKNRDQLKKIIDKLQSSGIVTSLFIEPTVDAVESSSKLGAWAVEFHTGAWCHAIDSAHRTPDKQQLLQILNDASYCATEHKIQSHFGHGLNYQNAQWLQLVETAEEANIGHAIIGRALFCGLEKAVKDMKALLNDPDHCPVFPRLHERKTAAPKGKKHN